MSINHQRLLHLLAAYADNRISTEDLEELLGYVENPDAELILLEAMEKIGIKMELTQSFSEDKARIYQQIVNSSSFKTQRSPSFIIVKMKEFRKYAAAAIIFMCLGVCFYFYKSRSNSPINQPYVNRVAENKIDMGSSKAILTLANGSRVVLDKNKTGTIAQQGSVNLSQKQGLLKYDSAQAGRLAKNIFNTISTPKGSNYQIILVDGTKVWLNTNTSLTYPIAFNGKTREVSIIGEAYFEVAHNKTKPFIVSSKSARVTVLGTHFNVNAYPDENMITTLLSGSVNVSKNKSSIVIKPDQDASILNDQSPIIVHNVDADEAIAWKNGYFLFHDQNIKEVMRTIARWYDVEIEFRGDMTGKTFGGTIARFENINKLLKGIELTGVIHFKIEGRRIIVMA